MFIKPKNSNSCFVIFIPFCREKLCNRHTGISEKRSFKTSCLCVLEKRVFEICLMFSVRNKWCVRRCAKLNADGSSYPFRREKESTLLVCLKEASCTYSIAFSPRMFFPCGILKHKCFLLVN